METPKNNFEEINPEKPQETPEPTLSKEFNQKEIEMMLYLSKKLQAALNNIQTEMPKTS